MSFPKCSSTMEHQHQSLLHWRSSRIKLPNVDNISISLLHYFWGQNPSGSKRTRGVVSWQNPMGIQQRPSQKAIRGTTFLWDNSDKWLLKRWETRTNQFPQQKDITSVLSYNKLPLAPSCSSGGTKLMPENCISLVTR